MGKHAHLVTLESNFGNLLGEIFIRVTGPAGPFRPAAGSKLDWILVTKIDLWCSLISCCAANLVLHRFALLALLRAAAQPF